MKLLKKYANRRIYDTDTSAFVKLAEIRQMVIDRVPFRVIDAKSEEDLTRSVLMQIIAEQESEGHESLLTNRVLQELIRFLDDKMVAILSPFLEQQILHSIAIQDQIKDQISKAFTQPYLLPEKVYKQMIDQYEAYTKMFSGEIPAAGQDKEED